MKKIGIICCAIMLLAACKEVFQPNITAPATGYLVVDGFINSSGGSSVITLSRTTGLSGDITLQYEHSAQVQVEGDDNSTYPMAEGTNGTYTSADLTLDPSVKYRVYIKTTDGKEYTSDYTPVQHTPPIDSISWVRSNDGVQVYINAHDDVGNTQYYQWKYTETWEVHSRYYSTLKYVYAQDQTTYPIGVTYFNGQTHVPDTSLLICYHSYTSRYIFLGTTKDLTSDRVYQPVVKIEPAGEKLGVLYSIEAKQYALSVGAYNFYEQMKKNTEELGTIFDAQPTDLPSNIHCVNDPSQVAVGYVEVTQEQTKRIFISNSDVPGWGYLPECSDQTVITNDPDSIKRYGQGLLPTNARTLSAFGGIVDFFAAPSECVDCKLNGGTTEKPSFWP